MAAEERRKQERLDPLAETLVSLELELGSISNLLKENEVMMYQKHL